jgi:outer membrane immunogenic protein
VSVKILRNIATLCAVWSAFAANYALAADLPPAPAPQAPTAYIPIAAPLYNWTGIYVGINGGWGFGRASWALPVANSGVDTDNGGIVGGTLGGNFQTGNLVFGVEGDWDYSAINTGTSTTICIAGGNCQTGNTWLSTIRGRAGYAADRVLFYLTAGGVFGNMQTTINGATTTRTQTGWTAGLGVEYAFAQNWSVKLEYLYADLGDGAANCATAACLAANGGNPVNATVSLTDNLVRLGVNYKF